MAHGKSPRSYKVNVGPILDRGVEERSTEVRDCTTSIPTLADCIKYGIDVKHAGEVNPSSLTLDNYLFLRDQRKTKQAIKNLYGFKSDPKFYDHLRIIGAYPEPIGIVVTNDPIDNHDVFTQEGIDKLTVDDEVDDPVVGESLISGVKQSKPRHHLLVVTKHICPVCKSEHGDYENADSCLQSHAWAVNIASAQEYIGGEFNCPASLDVNMSDGRVMRYVAFGYEGDDE